MSVELSLAASLWIVVGLALTMRVLKALMEPPKPAAPWMVWSVSVLGPVLMPVVATCATLHGVIRHFCSRGN